MSGRGSRSINSPDYRTRQSDSMRLDASRIKSFRHRHPCLICNRSISCVHGDGCYKVVSTICNSCFENGEFDEVGDKY